MIQEIFTAQWNRADALRVLAAIPARDGMMTPSGTASFFMIFCAHWMLPNVVIVEFSPLR